MHSMIKMSNNAAAPIIPPITAFEVEFEPPPLSSDGASCDGDDLCGGESALP